MLCRPVPKGPGRRRGTATVKPSSGPLIPRTFFYCAPRATPGSILTQMVIRPRIFRVITATTSNRFDMQLGVGKLSAPRA